MLLAVPLLDLFHRGSWLFGCQLDSHQRQTLGFFVGQLLDGGEERGFLAQHAIPKIPLHVDLGDGGGFAR